MTNCSLLISGALGNTIIKGGNGTNVYNDTNITTIWLNEDFTGIFDSKYWTNEWINGFIWTIIISVSISFIILSYCVCYARVRKTEMLKYTDIPINPILRPYCDHNEDILNIIYEFSGIIIYNKSNPSALTIQFLSKRALLHIFMNSLLLCAYFPLFYTIQHVKDSYNSYILIDCVYHSTNWCWKSDKNGPIRRRCGYEIHFDVASLCKDDNNIDFNDYVFRGEFNDTIPNEIDYCAIHKDKYEIRASQYSCCGCEQDCVKCGRCDKGCCDSYCDNCYAYVGIWVAIMILIVGYIFIISFVTYGDLTYISSVFSPMIYSNYIELVDM
eukprot:334330_1